MSEPTPPSDSAPGRLPPMPVPPPVRAGGDPTIRPGQVFLGMLIGGGLVTVTWVVTAALLWAVSTLFSASAPGMASLPLLLMFVPVGVLAFAIHRAARAGRKGLAVGIALFAGLAVLLVVACAGLVLGSL